MILIKIFFYSSFLSLILLLIFLVFDYFKKKDKFYWAFKNMIQMEKLKEGEIKDLVFFINESSLKKLWFSYFVLEESKSENFLNRAFSDLKKEVLFIQSAVINYLKIFGKKEFFEIIIPYLKSKDPILKLHAINSLKEISINNFDYFKEKFEKEPTKLIELALNLFEVLENNKKKELFFIIKKYFSKNENIMLKVASSISDFLTQKDKEELLYQLDLFPISFQEIFIKIFSEKMEVKDYIKYFNFKFNTSDEKTRFIYIYPFSLYYSEFDYKKTLDFIKNLSGEEMEIFFGSYFPDPENFVNLLLNLKKEISINTIEIILERLSILKEQKTIDVLENILENISQRDKLIFKFSNLIIHWKNEEIKPVLFWALTKIENPAYREKITNIIKEKRFDL